MSGRGPKVLPWVTIPTCAENIQTLNHFRRKGNLGWTTSWPRLSNKTCQSGWSARKFAGLRTTKIGFIVRENLLNCSFYVKKVWLLNKGKSKTNNIFKIGPNSWSVLRLTAISFLKNSGLIFLWGFKVKKNFVFIFKTK